MKARYLYSILFGVPGLVVALVVSFVIVGMAGGVLWLFIFGDDPWPAYAETILAVLFALVFLTTWLASLIAGFIIGKRFEQKPALNKKHVLASITVTVLFILLIAFQQISVGNLGPKSDGERCMDYCIQEGYSASSLPARDSGDRSCSCLDESGNETIKVPLDSIGE
jgi:hypothetical protein